jgi:CARDB
MRRALILGLLTSCLFPASAGAAPASVRLLECVPALAAQDRTAVFEARVRPARASERMQVRFTLQVREGGLAVWRRVVAAGLDEWLTSAAGVSRYSHAKSVRNLSAPAAYRMVVRFRWLDPGGAVVARSRATSRPCRQPDMRPDLSATGVEPTAPPEPGRRGYAVTVRNGGRSAAGPFSVALRAGGEQLAPLAVPGLEPGESRVLTFAGPPCAAGLPPVVAVDADAVVDERDEDDNVLVAACRPWPPRAAAQ